jgi:arginase
VPALRVEGAARTAQWAREQLTDCAGYWVHVDVDVLDPAVMPAVDAPDPGGIAFAELELLLAGLVGTPDCLGVELTVFDPDYDPDGSYAAEIVSTVVGGMRPLLAPTASPSQRVAAPRPAPDALPPSADGAGEAGPTRVPAGRGRLRRRGEPGDVPASPGPAAKGARPAAKADRGQSAAKADRGPSAAKPDRGPSAAKPEGGPSAAADTG